MARGVGKAFEKALAPREERIPSETGKHARKFEFGNKNRREIFQYLCGHPCSHTSMISRTVGLSMHATNWHLRRLVKDGYVSKMTRGKKTVFYPTDMIHTRDIPVLEILNTEKAKSIYLVILDRDGITQGDICEMLGLKHQAVIWYTKKLESLGLITSLEDGKYRRYYPTDLLRRKKDENTARLRNFKGKIIKRIRREMLSHTVLRSTENKLVLRLTRGGSKAVLTLHMNPFVTVLS